MNILKMNSYSKIESIFLCLALTILAVFILNVGSLFMILLPIANSNKLQLIGAGVSMILGFILIPILVLKSLIGFNYSILNIFNLKRFLIYTIIIFIVLSLCSINIEEIIHPFIVATCEEFLFRGLMFSLLLNKFTKFKSIVIGSLIFSLLLHLNGNFVGNFLTKFPSSIILYLVRDKFGLPEAIITHWLYNLFITKLLD